MTARLALAAAAVAFLAVAWAAISYVIDSPELARAIVDMRLCG